MTAPTDLTGVSTGREQGAVATSLADLLEGSVRDGLVRRDVARAVLACCRAAVEIGDRIASAPIEGGLDTIVGDSDDGDGQKALDVIADAIVERELTSTGVVATLASEERATADTITVGGSLAVAFDPLDGSKNLSLNAPIGLIFSVRPAVGGPDAPAGAADAAFLRPGREQLAAGVVLYGPATVLLLTTGGGTDLHALDPARAEFVRTAARLAVPAGTPEYAMNASNARHWSGEVRNYVADLHAGVEGPRDRDFNMRWLGALVGEVVRIVLRGGIYLYPGDMRPTHRRGRLRLLYEAHPVAMLVEQAGGSCTDGVRRILDLAPAELHERTPLVFGSTDKVERFARYLDTSPYAAEHAPLFARRGLFRD